MTNARTSRLRRLLRLGLAGLAVAFVTIQFFPAERTNPPVIDDLQAPADVKEILVRACYDCHSNQTRWPWYSRMAPISWWLADHVGQARRDLNFSDWPNFDFEAQEIEFLDIHEQIENGEMPLSSYLLLHPDARLSDADRQKLLAWAAVP